MLKALKEQNKILSGKIVGSKGRSIENFIIKLVKEAKGSYRNISGDTTVLIQPEIKGIDESSAIDILLKTFKKVTGESIFIPAGALVHMKDADVLDEVLDDINRAGRSVCKADYYNKTLYFRVYL